MNSQFQEVASSDENNDRLDDVVDPRVQIELERLNTATDDINKLEVDLDEAKATFRELLCESTIKIDNLTKKLGGCIEKSRPYYDARFKAKEALSETQKAAVRFERANSQHAAAKEMVYLAEEGLKAEGRCFDHAWQEMLNHATFRVNESEHERVICEIEHRHTAYLYHKAEHNVQILQQELKRAIAKSRPYYEMKAHFNQILEEQKLKVSAYEKSVTDAKMTYAEALRNLERISDEIHRNRRYDGLNEYNKQVDNLANTSSHKSKTSSTESSITESPDSTDPPSDEYLEPPEKMNLNTIPTLSKVEQNTSTFLNSTQNISLTKPMDYIKQDKLYNTVTTDTEQINFIENQISASTSNLDDSVNLIPPIENNMEIKCPKKEKETNRTHNSDEWTEINLNNSPEEIYYNNVYCDDGHQNPHQTIERTVNTELLDIKSNFNENEKSKKFLTEKALSSTSGNEEKKIQILKNSSLKKKGKLDNCLSAWISRNSVANELNAESSANLSRRQSLDMLWNSGTGERVKEILNQGMMMLNISNLTERRSNELKLIENEKDKSKIEKVDKQEFKSKKIPNPLEKTIIYLNAEEETSDNESLASVEMLTEDQISSLMMEPDINQVCQEILGTPLVEVCPSLQQT